MLGARFGIIAGKILVENTVVNTISPDYGPFAGGTTITITGTGLAGVTTVTIGGVTASITSTSDTQVVCTSPAYVSGTANKDIVLNGNVTVTNGFTYVVTFTTGQAAEIVIGQSNFTSNSSGVTSSKLTNPEFNGMVHNGYLYINDNNKHRILIFNPIPTANLPTAIGVLGQTSFTAGGASCTQSTFNYPTGMAVCPANGKLYVTDRLNNRVMVYASVPTAQTNAESVMGQPNFTTSTSGTGPRSFWSPAGIAFIGSKCILIEQDNNRVLIWNDITTYDQNSTIPDIVLGQTDFVSRLTTPRTASSLSSPFSAYSDGTKLIVNDHGNSRILIWNTFPTSNAQAANVVVGQADFTSAVGATTATGLNDPRGMCCNGTSIFVTDVNNNRIMIWYKIPTTNGVAANVVLGQINFTTATSGLSSTKFNAPISSFINGTHLYVSEYLNNRVMRFLGT